MNFFSLFLYLSCFITYSQDTTSVLYGEHSDNIDTRKDNLLRVFIDRNGHYYPENSINEFELRNSGESQLIVWAEKFQLKFAKICLDYGIEASNFSKVIFDQLQDAIIKKNAQIINNNTKDRPVNILVHGFRKKAYGQKFGYDTHSTWDNEYGRTHIKKDAFFVEIYWDGHYRKTASKPQKLKKLLVLGEMFRDQAVPNAENAGYHLRKLLDQVSTSTKLNLISHSTGTHVLTSLLYNKKKNMALPTPSHNEVNIILLASASSGKEHFKNYYSRNTSIDFENKDNYKLFIVYNEKDFVLKKAGFPRIKGNTTLGCNHQGETKQLKRFFKSKFINSSITIIPTSKTKNHTFKFYINSNAFSKIMNEI